MSVLVGAPLAHGSDVEQRAMGTELVELEIVPNDRFLSSERIERQDLNRVGAAAVPRKRS